MFYQTWKKYLPVIVLLMKRSAKEQQLLNLNHTDFERAAGGRKIKFAFSVVQLNNGRIDNHRKLQPVVSDLILVLQEDERSGLLIRNRIFDISMNDKFQLMIKNHFPDPKDEALPQTKGGETKSLGE